MKQDPAQPVSRRQLLTMIGMAAGTTTMYQAMHSLGFAAESTFKGPIQLGAAPRGASVLVLGAGIAGMVAALELRDAGYRVQVLEYNSRAGGRNWTLRGGDRYTELGGTTQECRFDPGLYINPGPWRLSYHHYGMLSYCRRLGVALETFTNINYNAYVHNTKAFGGKPQRLRTVKADYQGHVGRAPGQGDAQQCARCRGHGRGSRQAARFAALLGGARQGLSVLAKATRAATGAAISRTRAGA